MAVSTPLARVLAAGRSQFNLRVAEARRRFPTLDQAAFADYVEHAVDPVVVAVARRAPDRATTVVVAAFDVALELAGHGQLGTRGGWLKEVWQTLLPAVVDQVAAEPRAVLGALSNAAITLDQHPGARPAEWLAGMTRLAARAKDWHELRALGQLLAWRAGLAHYRTGALQAADRLSEPLALLAVDARAGDRWPDVRAALLADPWYVPAIGAIASDAEQRIGHFVGFGGPADLFPEPPEVRADAEGFVVSSGGRRFYLLADACGVALLPAAGELDPPAMPSTKDAPTLKGRLLTCNGWRKTLDMPEEGIGLAWTEHTLALNSAYSFAIRLLPRRRSVA